MITKGPPSVVIVMGILGRCQQNVRNRGKPIWQKNGQTESICSRQTDSTPSPPDRRRIRRNMGLTRLQLRVTGIIPDLICFPHYRNGLSLSNSGSPRNHSRMR